MRQIVQFQSPFQIPAVYTSFKHLEPVIGSDIFLLQWCIHHLKTYGYVNEPEIVEYTNQLYTHCPVEMLHQFQQLTQTPNEQLQHIFKETVFNCYLRATYFLSNLHALKNILSAVCMNKGQITVFCMIDTNSFCCLVEIPNACT